MKAGLSLRHQQHLTLSPKLQQAIKLLQLSTLDLQNEIQETMNNNPLLEGNITTVMDSLEKEVTPNDDSTENEFDALSPWDFNHTTPNIWPVDPDLDYNLEHYCHEEFTLKAYLHWQFNLCPSFGDLDYIAGTAIIDSLNEDGFLIEKARDLYQSLFSNEHYSFQEFETVRHYIQCLDPVGCAAESMTETLLIQLQQQCRDMPLFTLAKDILKHDAISLASKNFGILQKKYRISMPMINKIISLIQSTTHPNPGQLFHENKTEINIPDLFLRKKNGQWLVQWNPELTPKLSLNSYYMSLIPQAKDKNDRKFLQHNLQEAKWFIKNIQNRQDIILKVAQYIVNFHHQFFDNTATLQPLILNDVANALNIHVSTVSRAVNKKYIHTPKGLFELKYFFSAPAGKNNERYNAEGIQAKIKEILESETDKHHLTDQRIVGLLQNQGIKLARRTVAKYREFMGLSSSHGRKIKKW